MSAGKHRMGSTDNRVREKKKLKKPMKRITFVARVSFVHTEKPRIHDDAYPGEMLSNSDRGLFRYHVSRVLSVLQCMFFVIKKVYKKAISL